MTVVAVKLHKSGSELGEKNFMPGSGEIIKFHILT